jgi:hypothetical protein
LMMCRALRPPDPGIEPLDHDRDAHGRLE